MKDTNFVSPVISMEQARELEKARLPDDAAEWLAMEKAGLGIADGILRDYKEFRTLPDAPRVLVLVGKGHNGGDALLAAAEIMARYPRSKVVAFLTEQAEQLKPLTRRALEVVKGRLEIEHFDAQESADLPSRFDRLSEGEGFDICVDGLVGLSFKPPMDAKISALVTAVKDYAEIGLRAAVDLPSGLGGGEDALTLPADFTYATGSVKEIHMVSGVDCGRVRWVDLGFFGGHERLDSEEYFLNDAILNPIRNLRPAMVDKRNFGHLFIVGGSSNMPGALLMSVQAAVRSGVGRVTAFAPESVAASLAAQGPEAMWIPWPESENGTLSPRAMPLLMQRLRSASAVLVGPGMGRDRNTEQISQEIVSEVPLPVICDADSLSSRVVELSTKRKTVWGPVILTPHMGEFMAIAQVERPVYDSEYLIEFCQQYRVQLVLKWPQTRCCDGESVYCNTFGGAVLSRGGSGDLLAGLAGGNMAQARGNEFEAVARAVVWHGKAAEALARKRGQVAVCTTDILGYLSEVLRGE
ncbi:MAG: NAD(P)H-hydrate dehydratase [Verrucomicrobia bacterium]|nr:NAD(P)H-hydrate dehydratase [Verrucomicrobiota bacterium]